VNEFMPHKHPIFHYFAALTAVVFVCSIVIYALVHKELPRSDGNYWIKKSIQNEVEGRLFDASSDLEKAYEILLSERGQNDLQTIGVAQQLLGIYRKTFQSTKTTPLAVQFHARFPTATHRCKTAM